MSLSDSSMKTGDSNQQSWGYTVLSRNGGYRDAPMNGNFNATKRWLTIHEVEWSPPFPNNPHLGWLVGLTFELPATL